MNISYVEFRKTDIKNDQDFGLATSIFDVCHLLYTNHSEYDPYIDIICYADVVGQEITIQKSFNDVIAMQDHVAQKLMGLIYKSSIIYSPSCHELIQQMLRLYRLRADDSTYKVWENSGFIDVCPLLYGRYGISRMARECFNIEWLADFMGIDNTNDNRRNKVLEVCRKMSE